MYNVCLATFSCKKKKKKKKKNSLSLLMIERCSLMLNFIMQSRLAEHLSTLTFQKHVRSDLGLFEFLVNTGTFPKQIAVIDTFSKFRKFPDCACVQRANSPRDIIE